MVKEQDFLHSLLDLVIYWNFLALLCPTKDTSCISSDGHSNAGLLNSRPKGVLSQLVS